jgi:hypothetical protein
MKTIKDIKARLRYFEDLYIRTPDRHEVEKALALSEIKRLQKLLKSAK